MIRALFSRLFIRFPHPSHDDRDEHAEYLGIGSAVTFHRSAG